MRSRYLPTLIPWRLRVALFRERIKIATVLSVLAFAMSGYQFVKSDFPARHSLQAVAVGDVDERLAPNKQDRIDLRLAVVNAGNREAAILRAEIVTLQKEADGYAWVRIWPGMGEGFQSKSFKAGEIAIISLITSGYGHDYFNDPMHARPIDSRHHEFVVGVRITSLDSAGRIYHVLYPISQYKIANDWKAGPPSEGYTFDRRPHELLVNIAATIPPLAKRYEDDVP